VTAPVPGAVIVDKMDARLKQQTWSVIAATVAGTFSTEPAAGTYYGKGLFAGVPQQDGQANLTGFGPAVAYPGTSVDVTLFQALGGDANLDGTIGLKDASLVNQYWDPAGTIAPNPNTWTEGDFNDDGVVGLGDAAIVNQTWDGPYDQPSGGAEVTVQPDGSIILEANDISLYRIFVGDASGNNVGDRGALSYDDPPGPDENDPPSPIWWALEGLIPSGWPQPLNSDLTAGGAEESFGEVTIGSNGVSTRLDFSHDHIPIDTQVDVDLGALGPGNWLWLEWQVEGQASEFVQVVQGIPEPGTVLLLAVGFCGLLLWRRRWAK
jgi:hypothetical protein